MAHLIDESTGRAACFTAGQPAWHRLGVNVSECQTSERALELAVLNWNVEQLPVYASIDGGYVKVLDKVANVRSDTRAVLGVVGSNYCPLQNRDAFSFMDNLVGERLAMFETAGAIRGGRRVWMMARLPQTIQVVADDVVKPYLLLANSHDGTRAVDIMLTTVRVVCNNTLTLALSKAGTGAHMRIQHRSGLDQRVAEARRALGLALKQADQFEQKAKAMVRRSMTASEAADYFAGLVKDRSEKQQKKLLSRFFDNLRNRRNTLPGVGGTAWAAYNAVSEFADHQMTVRGKGLAKDENRLNSIWFGSAQDMKSKAFEAALAMAS